MDSRTSSGKSRQAAELVARAGILGQQGNLDGARAMLREASQLDPGNDAIMQAQATSQLGEQPNDLAMQCQHWTESLDDDDGEKILDLIHQNPPSPDNAKAAISAILRYDGDLDMADQITGYLLKHQGARRGLADAFVAQPTITYNKLFIRGDDSLDGLTTILLDKSAWAADHSRVAAERDAFQLALAQMMMAGQDHPERAMKMISRLLGTESENLKGLIDADGFDEILSQFDIRAPAILRSHATIATARLLQLSPDTSQQLISQYVIKRVERPTVDSLILAFSAAAAVFPMSPASAAQLFLSPGFAENFVSLITRWKSSRLEHAALEFLSAACLEKSCREAIREFCLGWLNSTAQSSADERSVSQASVVLVKIQQEEPSDAPGQARDLPIAVDPQARKELFSRFRSLLLADGSKLDTKNDAVEGLAYASINPSIREKIANDQALLRALIERLQPQKTASNSLYGALTILANLTAYSPTLTEEQKKLSQLKMYANADKPRGADPLERPEAVGKRCASVLKAGVIPMLILNLKHSSPNVQASIANILLSLSREKEHRATMAQQGAVKAALQLFEESRETKSSEASTQSFSVAQRTAAHSLARLLISINPHHVFGSSGLPSVSAVRPLVALLQPDPTSDSPDLLPVFEALLALTNLADIEDAAELIIRLGWLTIEDLLLSSNVMIRRGAVELICNLCASPHGVAKFADGSKQASNRLHILLALADVEDLATRRAAGGALAMLTEWDAAASAILAGDRGLPILLELCQDESDECKHRGVVCIRNLVFATGPDSANAKRMLCDDGGESVIRGLVTATKVQEITQTAIEILRALR